MYFMSNPRLPPFPDDGTSPPLWLFINHKERKNKGESSREGVSKGDGYRNLNWVKALMCLMMIEMC